MLADETSSKKISPAPFTLISTRLVPSRLAENCLPRERLLESCSSLDSDAGGRLFLITAPPGYGKSTLMAQIFRLVQDKHQSAAWLTLDEDDNDEEQFCYYLEAVLKQLTDSESGHAPGSANSQGLVSELVSRLAGLQGQFSIFLDDYHVIENPNIHASVQLMLKYLPENLNIFIGSRQPLPIPLARLKAADRLVLFQADNLSFDLDEAKTLLCEKNQLEISDPDLELLHRRTGGWPAVLLLTSLSLRATKDRRHLVETFSTAQDDVADFLSEELVAHLPPAQASFLRQIAIVDRSCAALCFAITGDGEHSESLVELQNSGLPIHSLDHNGQWFSLHPLFRDYLLRQLDRDQSVDQNELHRRASSWFRDQDMLGEAIQHAINGGDQEGALELLDDQGLTLLTRGYILQFLSLIRRLPEELLHGSQNLLIQMAWVQMLSNQLPDARRILEELKPQTDVMDPDRRVEVYAIESNICCIEDRLEEAEELVKRWLPEAPDTPPYIKASLQVVQAIISFNQRDFARVKDLTKAVLDLDTVPDIVTSKSYAVCTVALAYFAAIELKTGTATLGDQLQRLQNHVGGHSQLVAMIEPILGALLYHQGKLADAEQHYRLGIKALSVCATVDFVILVMRTRTRLLHSQGRVDEAITFLNEAQDLAKERNWLRSQACIMHERVRLFLALGELGKARDCMDRWLAHEHSGITPSGNSLSGLDEWTQTAKVRLMLVEGDKDGAAELLQSMISEFVGCGRLLRAMETSVLLARTYMISGKLDLAKGALSEALALDQENSVIQLFRDEGNEVIAALKALDKDLKRISETERHSLWQQQIGIIVEPYSVSIYEDDNKVQLPPNSTLVEKLTPKELATLALVVEGYSNKEISERLFVSTNTVKTHLQRAYGKLGVSSRTQAVRSLKEQGIFV